MTTNDSTGVEETNATMKGYLSNDGGESTSCGIRYGTTSGSYNENTTIGNYNSGTEFSNENGSLTSGDLYYFQAWASNTGGFATGSEYTFFTKPEDPDQITVESTTNNEANITIDKSDMGTGATSYTYIRISTSTFPTNRGEGTLSTNTTHPTTNLTSLSPGTHYYASAWAYGTENGVGQYSDTYITFEFNTSTKPVVVTNASTGIQETNATLHGYLTSNGSADTTTYFLYDNDASGAPYTNNESQGVISNQTEFQYDATSLTSGDLYYYNTIANNTAGWSELGGEQTFFTKPEDPDSITEDSTNSTKIELTIDPADMGTSATSYTYIRYSKNTAPTTRAEGTLGINTTDTATTITQLHPGTQYNLSAWAWGEEGDRGQYSDTYITLNYWTNPGNTTNPGTTTGTTWINITFTHGTNGSYTMIRRNTTGSAAYPSNRADGDQVDNTTNTYTNDTGLTSLSLIHI